ncbi:MAG TPA: DUF3515 family protein [Marmoricola sp.]|nr:DUF3515 family protein [Marmoricola sp.]
MAGAAVLCAAAVLSGCGGDSVHVDQFSVSPAGHDSCRQVLAALPDKVAGQARRTVTGSTYAAAWGDPAIVLRCGAALPSSFKGDPCITRNNIGWSVPSDQADDIRIDAVMTLAFREPVLQVRVPAHYRPNGPAEVMADLDRVVRAHTTSTGKHCS